MVTQFGDGELLSVFLLTLFAQTFFTCRNLQNSRSVIVTLEMENNISIKTKVLRWNLTYLPFMGSENIYTILGPSDFYLLTHVV